MQVCGNEVTTPLAQVRAGQGCRFCGIESRRAGQTHDADQAADELRIFSYESLVPSPGIAQPWSARHKECGQHVSPRINDLKKGAGGRGGCPLGARPARLGWVLLGTLDFPTGSEAHAFERECHDELGRRGLTPFLSPKSMGRLGGYSETYNAALLAPDEALAFVLELHGRIQSDRPDAEGSTND
ncbi:hypothetical protein SAMN05414137_11932 [Streptacidiphilus jiangxiensis]|uniref:Uncharacterized protein n=1 Tax=Streptacidiphilus jiangxiensis TaxID=235985 RepID=A0A1H7VWQ2_STRJI|nr:hypothetical protein SAMN05414137_11932 [Streptacidiphilus jiangxiensis]